MSKASLKLKTSINPGVLRNNILKQGVADRFTDLLLDAADEFQQNSPVGATGELKAGWDVTRPKKVAFGFAIKSSIENTADNALYRIVGRGPGKPPPIEPIRLWAKSKGIPVRRSYAIRNKIAKRGTDRWIKQDNWVGLDRKGDPIPGGRLDTITKSFKEKLSRSFE